MTKVFISGSMNIKNLDRQVQSRLRNIIKSDYAVIVGDADGADTSVQEYLKKNKVHAVVVYCTGEMPRNNIGHWPIQKVRSDGLPGTRAYFTAKDIRMADDCDYGFLIWDAKSTGTLSNAIELVKRRKKALVYINKAKEFLTVKHVLDLQALLRFMSEGARIKAEQKIKLTEKLSALKNAQSELFGT